MRSRTFIVGTICILSYWVLALVFSPGVLFQITNICVAGIAVGVVIAYGPSWIAAVKADGVTRGQHLVLGIVLAWFSDVVMRAYAATYRLLGNPQWLLDHPIWGYIPGFGLWFGLFAGIIHMTVRDAVDNRIPQRQYVIMGLVAAGVTVALFAMVVATIWAADEIQRLPVYYAGR